MSVKQEFFGTTEAGEEISLFTITNENGMSASVTDFGAILVRLNVPDREGKLRDVVLGYDSLDRYEKGRFFGATVGRHANRIAGAEIELDGVIYKLPANEGRHNLHTDFKNGFHKKKWSYTLNEDSVCFTLVSPDGENGFPGNLTASVTYSVLPDNSLKLCYEAVSDRKTLINLTNHSFFNIGGHDSGSIADERVTIHAEKLVEIDHERIPTGRLVNVEGTVFDFRTPRRVGESIDADEPMLKIAGGYDQCWVLKPHSGHVQHFARVEDDRSGIAMDVYTDMPGVEFYTANKIPAEYGKGGVYYEPRCALCLETQFFPDSIHHPNFPQAVYDAGEILRSETVFRFNTI